MKIVEKEKIRELELKKIDITLDFRKQYYLRLFWFLLLFVSALLLGFYNQYNNNNIGIKDYLGRIFIVALGGSLLLMFIISNHKKNISEEIDKINVLIKQIKRQRINNSPSQIQNNSYKELKHKKYFILFLIFLFLLITALIWYNKMIDTPPIAYALELDGDYRKECLIDFYTDFEDDTHIYIDSVKGKNMTVSLWGWKGIKQAIASENIWMESLPKQSLKFYPIEYTNYSQKYKIELPEKTMDVGIILDSRGTAPNGIFTLNTKDEIKWGSCLRIIFNLNKYTCDQNCILPLTDNVNPQYYNNLNTLKLEPKKTESGNYGYLYRISLSTHDATKRKTKEILFAFLIPLIFLTVEYFLKLIKWD